MKLFVFCVLAAVLGLAYSEEIQSQEEIDYRPLCIVEECERDCRTEGYYIGECTSASVCKCFGKRVEVDVDYRPLCRVEECERDCRSEGYLVGECNDAFQCKCFGKRIEIEVDDLSNSIDESQDELHDLPEYYASKQTGTECDESTCLRGCLALGCAGSKCIKDFCGCYSCPRGP